MKKTITKALLLAITAFTAVSCSLEDNTDMNNQKPTIDPPFEFSFVFDEKGMPYPMGANRELTAETQKKFREQVLGHAWEWVQTYEIQPNGYTKIDDYYSMYGVSPSHFYFASESEAVEYYYLDSENKHVFSRWPINVDATHGRIIFGSTILAPPFYHFFETYMLYNHLDTWHLVGVEYLGQRLNDGKATDVWGWSEYKRMTPERMEEIKQTYNHELLIYTLFTN